MALVTNLILTLTEQKLIKWSLKLYTLPSFTFLKTFFFNIKKTWLLTFFAPLHTFLQTLIIQWCWRRAGDRVSAGREQGVGSMTAVSKLIVQWWCHQRRCYRRINMSGMSCMT